ncbi:MAG: GNAT family N-acetyltransferase [Bacteroidetes bacterium]|nr:GNAT family N-acetyltransferase [Bacteroidota bacterium]
MPIEIKQAAAEDVHLVAPVFDAYRVFYHQQSDITAAIGFLQERLNKQESILFMALAEDKVVGFCQLYPIFSSVSMHRAWLLNDLYVNEAERGKGIASALLEQAKEWGKLTNAKWLLLQTGADNTTAQAVYEKNGWKRVNDFFYELPLE